MEEFARSEGYRGVFWWHLVYCRPCYSDCQSWGLEGQSTVHVLSSIATTEIKCHQGEMTNCQFVVVLMLLKVRIFWDCTLCYWVGFWRLEGLQGPHFQGCSFCSCTVWPCRWRPCVPLQCQGLHRLHTQGQWHILQDSYLHYFDWIPSAERTQIL